MAPFNSRRGSKLDKPGPMHKLFTRDESSFRFHPTPNIVVTSPDCGASNQVGNLNTIASVDSPAELFPTLKWHFDTAFDYNDYDPVDRDLAVALAIDKEEQVAEYFLIVEDLDGTTRPLSTLPLLLSTMPLPASKLPLLGAFYCIPVSARQIDAADLVKFEKRRLERVRVASRDLVGGFKYAEVDGGKVWKVPKGGSHRLHFQIVALAATIDSGSLGDFPTRESFQGAIEGLVLGWGEWIGIYEERK